MITRQASNFSASIVPIVSSRQRWSRAELRRMIQAAAFQLRVYNKSRISISYEWTYYFWQAEYWGINNLQRGCAGRRCLLLNQLQKLSSSSQFLFFLDCNFEITAGLSTASVTPVWFSVTHSSLKEKADIYRARTMRLAWEYGIVFDNKNTGANTNSCPQFGYCKNWRQ